MDRTSRLSHLNTLSSNLTDIGKNSLSSFFRVTFKPKIWRSFISSQLTCFRHNSLKTSMPQVFWLLKLLVGMQQLAMTGWISILFCKSKDAYTHNTTYQMLSVAVSVFCLGSANYFEQHRPKLAKLEHEVQRW